MKNTTIRVYGDVSQILKKYKFSFTPTFDSRLDRFDRNGKFLSAWSIGKIINSAGSTIQMLMFGDFATGEKYEWWSRKAISKEDAQAIEKSCEEERKKYRQAKAQRQKEAAKECEIFWDTLPKEASISGYTIKKGLWELYGARCDEQNLYVPLYSSNGQMQNLQRIEARGAKRFWPGGAITGNMFFVNGAPKAPSIVYLAEGYSTGCSIYESLRQRPSAAPAAREDEPSPRGDPSPRGAECSARGPNLPDVDCMEGNSTDNTAKDGGVLKAPRPDRPGDQSPLQASRAPGQRGLRARVDLRARLEHELLATLSPPHAQRRPDARPRQRGDQSVCQSPDETRTEAQGHQGEGFPPPSSGASRSSDGGAGQGPRGSRGQPFGQDRPADGYDLLQETREPERETDQRGAEALPGGLGPNPQRHTEGRELPKHSDTRRDQSGASPENYAVACAFTAGNLLYAARELRKRWASARIVLCADDDRWTKRPDGTPYNPGLEAAMGAAREVGGRVACPQFRGTELWDALGDPQGTTLSAGVGKFTDFNDLYLLEDGPARVRECLHDTKTPDVTEEVPQSSLKNGSAQEVQLVGYTKGGNPILPPPQVVADLLLKEFEGRIVKQDRDIFLYKNTHWKHMDQHGRDEFFMCIQKMCDNQCGPNQLKDYFEMLRIAAPPVPIGRNLFTSDPWIANFLNGTVHVTKTGLEFKPHNKLDYICNVLPYNYAPVEELPTNVEFEAMIERIFCGDSDWREKRRAVAQMFGACLAPMAPHLYMLFGAPGTGKSTLIKLAARLMHKENTCSVDPSDFSGFEMEIMAGKLVNYVTDIDVSKPIRDAIIKRIEDRVEITIKRKYEKALRAPLPAIHIFGGNAIPPTLEGSSRAHNRRWTFLQFNQIVAIGKFDKNFAERIFDSCPLGVLKFAIEGLLDLIACEGHFIQPASGVVAMENWQLENDPVGAFIKSIREGEVLDNNTIVNLSNDGALPRVQVYSLFKLFIASNLPGRHPMPAAAFYKRVEELGFRLKIIHGSRLIEGFSVGAGPVAYC